MTFRLYQVLEDIRSNSIRISSRAAAIKEQAKADTAPARKQAKAVKATKKKEQAPVSKSSKRRGFDSMCQHPPAIVNSLSFINLSKDIGLIVIIQLAQKTHIHMYKFIIYNNDFYLYNLLIKY